MAELRPITIVGGGLAGLTLGIALRRHGIPVTLVEAGRYPRHRVCGEFLSGYGKEVLANLGLLPQLQAAGLRAGSRAAFFSGNDAFGARELPEPAWCLSRLRLDALLAQEFRQSGGTLQENNRWRSRYSEGIVRASGRRITAVEKGWRWFGLKIHAWDVPLDADLEMHLTDTGYVGMCRVEEGRVNICGLFRSPKTQPDLSHQWKEWLRGKPGSALHHKLSTATFDESSFCSVAGLSFRPDRGRDRTECSLGDAIAMIPPVTGNGMSIALESAAIATPWLVEYSNGNQSWSEANRTISSDCERQFRKRLFWASLLHKGLFSPSFSSRLLRLGSRSDWAWRLFFSKTRS